MTPEAEAARGREADRILENPLVVEAFLTIEEFYMAKFRNSKATESDLREECHRTLYCLDQFRAQLRSIMTTGQFSEVALKAEGNDAGTPNELS